MSQYAYDLHIHTCLSPCGDAQMTPPNIVNMAHIKGLDVIAITDHNTAENAAAVIRAAKELPLLVIPGIEVTTAEEIHVVCLFPDVETAEKAGKEIYSHLPPIKNRPEFFGEQTIMDENENILGQLELLLPNASDIPYEKLPELVADFGGFCWPAHIDKQATSVLSVFGMMPEVPEFKTVEIHRPEEFFVDGANEDYRRDYQVLTNSDAHQLELISEREHFIELPELSFDAIKKAVTGK